MTLATAHHTHPHPDQHAAWREVGRAHLWSAEPGRALEVLAPLHRVRPWDREVQHLMLDALFALGRSESDFAWTLAPVVVRLDAPTLDRLHRALLANGGPVALLDLLLVAADEGYPAFSATELLAALDDDPRFALQRSGLAPESAVVARAGGRPIGPLGHPCDPSRASAPACPVTLRRKIGHLPE